MKVSTINETYIAVSFNSDFTDNTWRDSVKKLEPKVLLSLENDYVRKIDKFRAYVKINQTDWKKFENNRAKCFHSAELVGVIILSAFNPIAFSSSRPTLQPGLELHHSA